MSRRMLPTVAPLYALVIAYPLLWALGLAYFIWPLGAVMFALPLLFTWPVHWRSCRGRFSISTLWNIAILIAGVEMWFYDVVPTSMFLLMIASALACRSIVAGDYAWAADPAAARGVRRLPAHVVA